jgi:catechol 2,3-dioxygenase-like lactoylglutathione lyase family enzyme
MEWAKLVPELTVTNLNASLNFYVRVVGFDLLFSRDEPPFAYLDFEGAQLMLEEMGADGWQTSELVKPFGRGINFQIECADVMALRERFLEAGIAVFREPADHWYAVGETLFGARELLAQDPDGYLLRFSENLDERTGEPTHER